MLERNCAMSSQENSVTFVTLAVGVRLSGTSPVPVGSAAPCERSVQTRDVDLCIPGLKAFIARPDEKTGVLDWRGVILLSDIYGYEDMKTRAVAERIASSGFPTVVPDLFYGNPWKAEWNKSNYESWRALSSGSRVDDAIRAAAQELTNSCGVRKFGFLGFCFGGGRVLEEISKNPEDGIAPSAAVAFYPTRFDAVHVGKNANCPLLFISGDKDDLVPMQVIEQFLSSVEENKEIGECEIRIFEDAGHAFVHKPESEQDTVDSEICVKDAIEWFHKYM